MAFFLVAFFLVAFFLVAFFLVAFFLVAFFLVAFFLVAFFLVVAFFLAAPVRRFVVFFFVRRAERALMIPNLLKKSHSFPVIRVAVAGIIPT